MSSAPDAPSSRRDRCAAERPCRDMKPMTQRRAKVANTATPPSVRPTPSIMANANAIPASPGESHRHSEQRQGAGHKTRNDADHGSFRFSMLVFVAPPGTEQQPQGNGDQQHATEQLYRRCPAEPPSERETTGKATRAITTAMPTCVNACTLATSRLRKAESGEPPGSWQARFCHGRRQGVNGTEDDPEWQHRSQQAPVPRGCKSGHARGQQAMHPALEMNQDVQGINDSGPLVRPFGMARFPQPGKLAGHQIHAARQVRRRS
jgi:hypothetical protein